jgi:hypothetical protein
VKTSNGYVLFRNSTVVVVIATGIKRPSANKKTGKMVQVWILRSDINPMEAIKTGKDARICGKCPHRGIKGKRARTCYVQVAKAPLGIYGAFKRGVYPFLPLDQYAAVFGGKAIRFGAYGDPAVIPETIVAELSRVSARHTGYTHQWRTAGAWLKPYVMASCDSLADYTGATAQGWRTFRVTVGMTPQAGEILCPASSEAGMRTQCARCGLCNGAGVAKNIYIPVHGASKKSAFTILQ